MVSAFEIANLAVLCLAVYNSALATDIFDGSIKCFNSGSLCGVWGFGERELKYPDACQFTHVAFINDEGT